MLRNEMHPHDRRTVHKTPRASSTEGGVFGIWNMEVGIWRFGSCLCFQLVPLLDGDLGDGAGVFAEVQEQVVGRGGLWELDAEFQVLGRQFCCPEYAVGD